MIRFHRYFKDGAILQRNQPITVIGYADGLVECLITSNNYLEKKQVDSVNGKFSVEFSSISNTVDTFTIKAVCNGESAECEVTFGDVYVTMGQSNMSYSLASTEDYAEWINRAKKVKLKILDLCEQSFENLEEVKRPVKEQFDLRTDFNWVSNEKLENVSAISVQVGVLIAEKQNVPIGVIHTAMGGLSIESYLTRESVERDGELVETLKEMGRYQTVDEYNKQGVRNYTQLGGVWNEKIAPLLPFKFCGFVWYLGESSAYNYDYAVTFLKEMNVLFGNIEKAFGRVPFIAVQIAQMYYPYGDKNGYVYVNEAISNFQKTSPLISVIPIYDVEPRWLKPNGDYYFHPIHPVNKAPISIRIADALTNGRKKYPQIEEVEFIHNKAICSISDVGEGLKETDVYGFTIAGEDKKYYQASAKVISCNKIEVTSNDVEKPTELTYAFMNYQQFCNVKTKDNAPLLPYRTTFEPVNDKYCFVPAFIFPNADYVYENCFGWQIGTCHKVPVWGKGEIYRSSEVKISYDNNCLVCEATPDLNKYNLFGISPSILLSGHKRCFDSFNYLNFKIKSSNKTIFYGVVARLSNGEVYRLNLLSGEKENEFIELKSDFMNLCASFLDGNACDSSKYAFSAIERSQIVQLEFLFRAEKPVTVKMQEFILSDKNLSIEEKSETENNNKNKIIRNDVVLPTM